MRKQRGPRPSFPEEDGMDCFQANRSEAAASTMYSGLKRSNTKSPRVCALGLLGKSPAMTDSRAGSTTMGPGGLTAVFGMGTGVALRVCSPGNHLEYQLIAVRVAFLFLFSVLG